jgi:putative N-acetylmannosamine-6-phosphate epimerase
MINLSDWIATLQLPDTGQTVSGYLNTLLLLPHCKGSNPEALLEELRRSWANALYEGRLLSPEVARHLIEHGTCDDSAWVSELYDYADAS